MASSSTPNPIHFFKIISARSLQEEKIVIPVKFVKKFGEALPKTVFLKPPNGVEWEINLMEHDGKIWFEKGWKEFSEYHSLGEGHFVVFRYETSPHIPVNIFDMSCLEIDYPFERVEGEDRVTNVQANKVPDVINLEECRPGQKRKGKLVMESSDQANRVLNVTNLELEECIPRQKRKGKLVMECQPSKRRNIRYDEVGSTSKMPNAALHHSRKKRKDEPMNVANDITAPGRATASQSCNPSFLIVMRSSYVNSTANLHLPFKFFKKHFDLSMRRRDIKLQLVNGRVWPATYRIREAHTEQRIELTRGWKKFRKDNTLNVGDACTFELIDRTTPTFQVHISKKTDNSSAPSSQGEPMNAAKQITALDTASNTSFRVVIHPSYIHSKTNNLYLPLKYVKRHFDLAISRGEINLGLVNGRVWPVSYLIRQHRNRPRFELTRGWKRFTVDNNLTVGDVCTFEIIHKTKLTFQVEIFRKSDNASCSSIQEFPQMKAAPQIHEEKATTNAKQITVLNGTSSLKPCNPSFSVVMNPKNIHKYTVNVPLKFGERHFDLGKDRGDVNLQLSIGRTWPASYYIFKNITRTIVSLTNGWNVFVKENNLKVGDVCTFELIDRIKLTFQVNISRSTNNSYCPKSQEKLEQIVSREQHQ